MKINLKNTAPSTGGWFVSAIVSALSFVSNDLLRANNADSSRYRAPIVGEALRVANTIRKEVNERRAANGNTVKVSQNYVIDRLGDEADEEIQLTEAHLDGFATSVKRYLGGKGFVSSDEARQGFATCIETHLANLQDAEKTNGSPVFEGGKFAMAFSNIIPESDGENTSDMVA